MAEGDKSQDVWRRDEIESPCVQVCVIHPESRLCVGCKRTIDEIGQWSRMSPEARALIMSTLPERNVQPKGRRGGRARKRSV